MRRRHAKHKASTVPCYQERKRHFWSETDAARCWPLNALFPQRPASMLAAASGSLRLAPPACSHVCCRRGGSYLHVGSQRFIRVLQAVPVLPAQGERHPRKAVGTVLGYVGVHALGAGGVGHRHVLIEQGLRDYVLRNGRERELPRLLERRKLVKHGEFGTWR